MNLSLYSIKAFIILDTEGHRVLSKYYRPKGHPQGESKDFLTLKEQKAFEKGLWQKTKKPGGEITVAFCSQKGLGLVIYREPRGYHPLRFASRRVQALA